MKIVKHFYLEGTLQRSLVRYLDTDWVRIARWVKSNGELRPIEEGVVPVWRKNPGTDSSEFVLPVFAQELERVFVATLVSLNEEAATIPPTYHYLEVGEIIQAGDEWTADNGKTWALTVLGEKTSPIGQERVYSSLIIYRRAVLSRSPDAAD